MLRAGIPATVVEATILDSNANSILVNGNHNGKRFNMWIPSQHVKVEDLGAGSVQQPVPSLAPVRPAPVPVQPSKPAEVRVRLEGEAIVIRCDFIHKDICKSIPGANWKKDLKAWTYPKSPATAQTIDRTFARMPKEYDEGFRSLLDLAEHSKEIQSRKTDSGLPDVPCSKTSAWNHQRQAFWFARDLPACMLALDMGCGKSKVAVDLIVNRGHKRILIICPGSVVGVWPKQFRTHAGKPVNVVPLRKEDSVARKTEEARQVMALAKLRNEPIAIVINYESAWREPFCTWSKTAGFDFVILDESHRIKSPGGRASMYCGDLGKKVPYRLCLTGTPMPHSPLDVYAQYRFLARGIYGTSFAKFRQTYSTVDAFGKPDSYVNEEDLNSKFYSIAFRVTKDILDLPPYNHIYRNCSIGSSARKLYEKLKTEFYAEVTNGEITAANALTRLLRFQQITSGYIRNDNGEDMDVDSEKPELLADILEDLPVKEPVIVFCRFQHDLDTVKAVCEKQGRIYGELSGRQNDLTKDSTMPDTIDVMAVQIQAGGVGIDLTRAHYAIYYSIGFSLGDYEQSLARVHRPGQTQPTTYYHLVAENTVDERVYDGLAERKNIVEYVLGLGQKGI
jgi:SNF2 family DNA or RNA helicase